MRDRMPCRISDGPQEPGEVWYTDRQTSERFLPEEETYDLERQEELEREKQIADDLNEECVRVTRWLNQGC